MKSVFLFTFLILNSIVLLSQDSEQLSKPKFGVSFNAVSFDRNIELNGHLQTSDKTSLYLGVFGSPGFTKGMRLGAQHELLKGRRLSFDIGAGLSFTQHSFTFFDYPKPRSVDIEIPLELKYHLSEKFAIQFGFRSSYNLVTESARNLFLPAERLSFFNNVNFGVKYSFGN